MNPVANLREEEKALGSWPRRLLHIPTLTSHEWQPGNIYGSAVAPAYNALTYTWGRWKLPHSTRLDILPLEISGVAWDLPRIDPAFFAPDEILHVIRRCGRPSSHWTSTMRKSTPVDFLWLDVACIDQRESEPRSAAEIGRQAAIFEGAQHVFAWLSTFSALRLQDTISALHTSNDLFSQKTAPGDVSTSDFDGSVTKVLAAFRTLSVDPWFSSLWTLQEAFLRQDAFLLSRSGETARVSHFDWRSDSYDTTLEDVLSYYEHFHLNRQPETQQMVPRTVTSEWLQVLSVGEQMGFFAMQTQNALSAYSAARNRNTMKEEDRFYGIQQIFGFRLGKSAVDAVEGVSFAPDCLENQLGEHLLKEFTIQSQVHNYTRPARLGRGWMINQNSVIPNVEYGIVSPGDLGGEESRLDCSLSVCERAGNVWGYFEGRVCAFHELHEISLRFEKEVFFREIFSERSFLKLHLDVTPELNAFPAHYGFTYDQIPSGKEQRTIAGWLAKTFQDEELVILLLGYLSGSRFGAANVGLILLRKELPIQHWHRLGFCSWEITYTTIGGEELPERPFFEGLDPRWKTCSGLFG